MTSDPPPLILVVSGDQIVRQQLVHDIAHRFGADYTVHAAPTTAAALDRLEGQVSSGAATALVIVDERLGARHRRVSCSAYIGCSRRPSGFC